MKKSYYNRYLRDNARVLRNNSTLAEVILWSKVLKNQQMKGYVFNRQFSMKIKDLNLIADFICRNLKQLIEVDGYSHRFKFDQDKRKDKLLSDYSYTVLRISEQEVKYDLDNVIRVIESKISELE